MSHMTCLNNTHEKITSNILSQTLLLFVTLHSVVSVLHLSLLPLYLLILKNKKIIKIKKKNKNQPLKKRERWNLKYIFPILT